MKFTKLYAEQQRCSTANQGASLYVVNDDLIRTVKAEQKKCATWVHHHGGCLDSRYDVRIRKGKSGIGDDVVESLDTDKAKAFLAKAVEDGYLTQLEHDAMFKRRGRASSISIVTTIPKWW